MEVVASIDQGTQSTRVFLFDRSTMQPVAHHQVSFPQIHPHPGWCEHDPLEIWFTVKECLRKAAQEAEERVGPIQVLALGITNQRETCLVWDRNTGQPLHNALVWLDGRTSDLCARMEKELGSKDYFRSVTGLPISTYFSAFKFRWLYENVEAVKTAVDSGTALFGTIDTWLIWQLTGGRHTGVHVTDVTNASRTMLMDLSTCSWHQPFLEIFGVPPGILPRIVSNAEVYGRVSDPTSGPFHGAPISGCLGDQMAAVLGQRCVEGEAKNTYGTGCFMLLNTGPKAIPSAHGLLTTLSFKLGPSHPTHYALEGAVAVAGLGISWLRDNLGIVSGPQEAESLAASVPDTGGVFFVPAFSGLLAPRWDASARGSILGLTGFSTRAHIARAMLEAICFQTVEVLEAMRKDADLGGLKLLRVDGGATRSDLLMQLQADLLQVTVSRPHFQETTALGAALAAGLGAGIWTEADIFSTHAYNTTTFTPSISAEAAAERYTRWGHAVSRSQGLSGLLTPPAGDGAGNK